MTDAALQPQVDVPKPWSGNGDATDPVNEVDLAFVVDTTGSMGGLIDAAKRRMVEMVEALTRAAAVRLNLGVVEYRDHPPQDRLVYRVHDLTANLPAARATIDGLAADGGGDLPEAVLDGVLAACRELRWRPHARRLAVLVGDAPPHGASAPGDSFRAGCPCGQTIESVTAAAEEARVRLYALGLTPLVTQSFSRLARLTGGEYFSAAQGEEAITRLEGILRAEFGKLDLDRRVLAEHRADPGLTIDAIAERLASAPGEVGAAMTRLGARRLLMVPARPAAADG